MLSLDTPTEVYFLLLYYDLQDIRHFMRFHLSIITKSYLSQKLSPQNSAYHTNFKLIPSVIFQRLFFTSDPEYTTFSKAWTVYTQQTKKYSHIDQTLKDGALSGVGR